MTEAAPARRNPIHWPTVAQAGLSAFAMLSLWGTAFTIVVTELLNGMLNRSALLGISTLILQTSGMVAIGFLLLPSVVLSGARLVGRRVALPGPGSRIWRLWQPAWLLMLFPIFLGLGTLASRNTTTALWLLPIPHLLAVTTPVVFIAWLAMRGLQRRAPQLVAGVAAAGMALSTPLAVFLEFFAIIGFIVVGIAYISTNPDYALLLERLAGITINPGGYDPNRLFTMLEPLFNDPVVIVTALAAMSVVMPLIEELLKPVGVWLLAGKELTPAEGFAFGALSGAGFALFENFFSTIGDANWIIVTLTRTGTVAMHIFTAALTGWALAVFWRKRNYLTLIGPFLLAFLLHGLWNAMAIIAAFTEVGAGLTDGGQEFTVLSAGWLNTAPFVMGILGLTAILGVLVMNRRLLPKTLEAPQTEVSSSEIQE